VQAAGGGGQGSGGRRGTLRPASDATWRPKMTCAFLGPDGYALLFLLYADTKMTLLFVKA